jgi:hypothetical protein
VSGIATAPTFTANTHAGSYTVTANLSTNPFATAASFSLTNLPGPPARMTTSAGTPQHATVGTPFETALAALVQDAAGNPVGADVRVTFTVGSQSGASASFPDNGSRITVRTNGSGIATAPTLTANGTPGSYSATANLTDGSLDTPATFTLFNDLGPPDTLTPNPGTLQSAVVTTAFPTLSVTVKDASGNLVADGTQVSFTVVAAGNGASTIFDHDGSATTKNGVATMRATANTIAGRPYTVTAATNNGKKASFQLQNTPGVAQTLTPELSAAQSAPINTPFSPLSVKVTDANGNLVADGTSVIFAVMAAGNGASATFSSGGNATTTNGVASITATANSIVGGPYIVTATSNGHTATFALTNTPGPAVRLTVTGYPSPVVSGTSHPFTVTIQDQAGNTATGYTGTMHFTSTDRHAMLPADYTFVASDAGTHTFAGTFGVAGTWAVTATDTTTASITGTQTGIVVTAAALVSITVTPATATLRVGQAQQFVATGRYADNSTADLTSAVTWSSDTVSVASVDASGKVTGASPGTAQITATLGTVSGQTSVTVTAPTAVGIPPATQPANRPGGTASEPGATPAPSGTGRSGGSGGTAPLPAPTGR